MTLSFDSGPNPSSLAIADFNGDGKLDLAVANSTSNSVSVLLGKGDGTFQAAFQYAAGPNPKSVAVSDFNGDGRPDLAVANFGGNSAGSVSVLLGKGDGTFEDAVNSSLGSESAHPTSVAVGDFNGDGKPDLALALYSDTRLLVLLGRGGGTFQDAVYFGTGAKPAFGWPTPFGQWSVATGDFNGDSKPDLIVTNPGKVGDPFIPGSAIYGSVSVLLGKGDGSFQAPINLDLPAFPYSAVVDDFNGDGKADLAVANYGSISGAPYITGVSLLLGKGDGTFQNPVEYAAGGNPVQVVAGDLNGDGKPDLAVANSASGNVSVLLGKGDGAFQSQVSFGTGWGPQSVAVGDFNGDHQSDLAVTGSSGVLLLNTCDSASGCSTPGFAAARPVEGGPYPGSLLVSDFNGDGRPDVAMVSKDRYVNGQLVEGSVSMLLGDSDGNFRTAINAADRSGNALGVGDFNGDGQADLAVANGGVDGSTLSVLFGKGDGTFQFAADYPVGVEARAVAVGDFNGDGKPDLVVVLLIAPQVSVLLNKGNGTFQDAVNYRTGLFPLYVAVVDLNRDGKLDLVVTSLGSWDSTRGYINSGVSVLLGRGDGTFQAGVDYGAGSTPLGLAVADFNGDRKLDLAVGISSGVALILGKGDGTFQAAINVAARGGPLAVTDFNGDGKPDLAVADGFDTVLLGKGDGTFEAPVNLCATWGAAFFTASDFNGDDRPDLLVWTTSNNLSVLMNTGVPSGVGLSTVRRQETVSISWPLQSTGFVLESTTNLGLTNWQPAVEALTTNNGRLEVTVPLDQPQRFFRLHKP